MEKTEPVNMDTVTITTAPSSMDKAEPVKMDTVVHSNSSVYSQDETIHNIP